MKRGGEYSLKGTRGLGEKRVDERKKEGSRDNEETKKKSGELKQRTNMIGKQTSKQAWMKGTASLLACTDTCECMCWIFILAGDKLRRRARVWAGIRRPERQGGGQSSGRTRPGRNLASLKYQTLTLSLVCLSAFLFSSSARHHNTTFYFAPQPRCPILLVLSYSLSL